MGHGPAWPMPLALEVLRIRVFLDGFHGLSAGRDS
jgi:hypothetical protein